MKLRQIVSSDKKNNRLKVINESFFGLGIF